MTITQLKVKARRAAERDALGYGSVAVSGFKVYAAIRGPIVNYRFVLDDRNVTPVEFNRALAARIT